MSVCTDECTSVYTCVRAHTHTHTHRIHTSIYRHIHKRTNNIYMDLLSSWTIHSNGTFKNTKLKLNKIKTTNQNNLSKQSLPPELTRKLVVKSPNEVSHKYMK